MKSKLSLALLITLSTFLVMGISLDDNSVVQASAFNADDQQPSMLPDWGTWHDVWTFDDRSGSAWHFRWSEGGQLSILVGEDRIEIPATMWQIEEDVTGFEVSLEEMLDAGASKPRDVFGFIIQVAPGILQIGVEIVTYEEAEDGEFHPVNIQNGELTAYFSLDGDMVILIPKKCECKRAYLGDCTAHQCNQGTKCNAQPPEYNDPCVWKDKGVRIVIRGEDVAEE